MVRVVCECVCISQGLSIEKSVDKKNLKTVVSVVGVVSDDEGKKPNLRREKTIIMKEKKNHVIVQQQYKRYTNSKIKGKLRGFF